MQGSQRYAPAVLGSPMQGQHRPPAPQFYNEAAVIGGADLGSGAGPAYTAPEPGERPGFDNLKL